MRDYLRSQVPLTPAECEVGFDGQPHPVCGERFVSVHPGRWSGVDLEGLEEEFGVNVTVTFRMASTPRDRVGANLLTGPTGEGLEKFLERVKALLHLDKGAYPVLALANATIGATANGFVEPLRFRDGGQPTAKGPDWFSSDGAPPPTSTRAPRYADVGLAQTLVFDGAKRVQVVEEQT